MPRSERVPPGGDQREVTPLGMVERYERQVFSFVSRSVRNPADAADLTQDVFAALLESLPRFDSRRPLGPWVFGIAAKVVARHFRHQSMQRKGRQVELARSSEPPRQEDEVESREVANLVRKGLAALPDDSRMLLVLQYYHGLSQREIAESLDMARSTVRDRIRSSLNCLEQEFRATGYAAAIPLIAPSMREEGLLTVPAAVSETLRNTAIASAAAGTLSSSIGVPLGGVIVLKKLVTGAVLTTVVLALGVGIGQWQVSEASSDLVESQQMATVRIANLENQNRALTGQLEQARQALSEVSDERELLARQLRATAADSDNGGESEPSSTVDSTGPSVDWDAFADAFATHRRILGMLATKEQKNLTPAEEVALYKLRIDLELAAAELRKETPYPVLEADVLPQYLGACLGGLLELDDAQLATLSEAATAALMDAPALDDVSPLEAYEFRREVFDRVTDTVGAMLGEQQAEEWSRLEPLWRDLSEGNHRKVSVGVEGANLEDRIVQEWQVYYDLSDAQASRARFAGSRMLEEARALIEPHLRDRIRRGDLDPATLDELERAFRKIQLDADGAIAAGLSAEQVRRARERLPLIFEFEIGSRIEVNVENGRGF